MTDAGNPPSTAAWSRHFGIIRVYAWLGGISLCLLVFLVPPFQVPDESQHFFRSYQLSKLEVWSPQQKGIAGSDLPASVSELERYFLGTNERHIRRELPRRRLMETLGEMRRPLDAERTIFVDLSDIQSYAPLPYVPQAFAIAAGRTLGVGPLGLLYLGRFANALVALLVTTLAISLLPVGRTFALLVALLPMTQFVTASVSPDALTIASALLFTAIVVRFLTDGGWSAWRKSAAFAAGMVMSILKPVYLPLLFAGLGALLGKGKFSSVKIRHAIYWQMAAALLTITLIALWLGSIPASSGAPGREGVNAAGQLAYLADDIFRAARIVVRSIYIKAEFLGQSTVGLLGWLNLPLPGWVYLLLGLAFPLSVFGDQRPARLGGAAAAWLVLVAVAVVPPIELALYLGWTPVAAYFVEGVQGRYFIPALPMLGAGLAALMACRMPSAYATKAYICVVAIIGAATVAMHVTIIRSYGL